MSWRQNMTRVSMSGSARDFWKAQDNSYTLLNAVANYNGILCSYPLSGSDH